MSDDVCMSTAATPDQIEREDAWIELRRAPGVCCPDPSCDYRTGEACGMCGHRCDECGRKKA
jgi:hypothetical protein